MDLGKSWTTVGYSASVGVVSPLCAIGRDPSKAGTDFVCTRREHVSARLLCPLSLATLDLLPNPQDDGYVAPKDVTVTGISCIGNT